jgi:hypothetical protein
VAFPDDRDRRIIRKAEQCENLAIDLANWVGEYNPQRHEQDLLPVPDSDEFELTRLRRLASNLYSSAKVPVAAAVYGPSQVGKSLFVGRVLVPSSDDYTPLGRDEQSAPPAYYQHLSFDTDLNPQSGSNEATALVTRFTTKDRIQATAPDYPVIVRALTRAQWLRVMARGFAVECATPERAWNQGELEELFEEISKKYAAADVDRGWRLDILDAYAYMRTIDRRGYPSHESVVNGLLTRYPLSEDGYVQIAANLFWDSWDSLTQMFVRINAFLAELVSEDHDPAILTHWAGVRFLLDTQRAKVHERRTSRCFQRCSWEDFQLAKKDGWHILEYHEGRGGGNEPQAIIQASMLEMAIPILPHRLSDDWRKVIEQIDILDIPGMRAGRMGAEEGKRFSADTLDEQMEIVKRGKVAYLFERYTEEMLIQTLLLLARGGNLEVTAQMKAHIDKWGRARYGEKVWPMKVKDKLPALFLGITGIDEEFRDREEYADPMLYNTRFSQLADALADVMSDFGGKGKQFTNCYPIRYPGTWDTNEQQREKSGKEKWTHAGKAFLKAEMVQTYVGDADRKWQAAMTDGDGGLSLISAGWKEVTTAEKKQDQLEKQVDEVLARLLQLARGWAVDPDANVDREKRIRCAERVIDWLTRDRQLVYDRVQAMEETLCLGEGAQMGISDFADMPTRQTVGRPDSMERRFPRHLQSFMHEWATSSVPQTWERITSTRPEAGPWLGMDDLAAFARYLKDYLLSEHCFDDFSGQLLKVIGLKLRDESAKRRARRKYARIIMNDFVMNPGPDTHPLGKPPREAGAEGEGEVAETDDAGDEGEAAATDTAQDDLDDFGLMGAFVTRWRNRLPQALALGAGTEVKIPPGNSELFEILEPFEGR